MITLIQLADLSPCLLALTWATTDKMKHKMFRFYLLFVKDFRIFYWCAKNS